jgi:hypothetical protein
MLSDDAETEGTGGGRGLEVLGDATDDTDGGALGEDLRTAEREATVDEDGDRRGVGLGAKRECAPGRGLVVWRENKNRVVEE